MFFNRGAIKRNIVKYFLFLPNLHQRSLYQYV